MIPEEEINELVSRPYPWETLRGKRILIAGATGLVGSYLGVVLAKICLRYNFEVKVMSRSIDNLNETYGSYTSSNFSVFPHDVNESIGDEEYDIVVHCASNTHPILYSTDPIGTITANTIGLNNLLHNVKSGGRFIFLSSVEIYGENRGDVEKFDESYCGYIDCNTLRAGYNESKRLGEALCQAYIKQRNVNCIVARLSRTYGPSMKLNDSKAISQFILSGALKKDIILKSKGNQLYSYCHSFDAADAIFFLLFYGEIGQAYNIAGLDSDCSLLDLATMISELSGSELKYDVPDLVEQQGYSKSTVATLDISKICSLGWKPSISLRVGLDSTVKNLRTDLSSAKKIHEVK